MDVQYCGSCHRLHAKLGRRLQHIPSPHPAMWNAVISTICSTDARKAVPIRPIQPEMTQIKEPTDSTRLYSLSPTSKLPCQNVVLTVSNNKTQLIDLIRQTWYLIRICWMTNLWALVIILFPFRSTKVCRLREMTWASHTGRQTHRSFTKWLMLVPLAKVGDSTLYVEEVRVQSAPVRLTCYGHPECSSLTDAGQKIWSRKFPRNISDASTLQSIPSTNEYFMENMAMASMQYSLDLNSPKNNPLRHEWTRNNGSTPLKLLRKSSTVPAAGHGTTRSTSHPSKNDASTYACLWDSVQVRLSDYSWEQFRLTFRIGSTTMKQWCWLEE